MEREERAAVAVTVGGTWGFWEVEGRPAWWSSRSLVVTVEAAPEEAEEGGMWEGVRRWR